MKANYKCSNWLLLSSLVLMLIQYSCQQEDLLIYEAKKSDVVMSLKEGGASIQNVTLENAGTLSERVTDDYCWTNKWNRYKLYSIDEQFESAKFRKCGYCCGRRKIWYLLLVFK